MASPTDTENLFKTPLFALHEALGAKIVPFAGYAMPVQYKLGVMKEHQWTRENAGLFDVSHMGQAVLEANDGEDAATLLEALTPSALQELKPGRQRYSMLLNDQGGILDDLMVARPLNPLPDTSSNNQLYLVVNAACKAQDFALIEASIAGKGTLTQLTDRALLALQGPAAEAALASLVPEVAEMVFMQSRVFDWHGVTLFISRSGYTGEDGFEISVPADKAEDFAKALLADERVAAIGLGARDSLRLEAGLPLYGHDLDPDTNPVEANLTFAIGKRRKIDKGFPGAEKIMSDLFDGPARRRVGLLPEGRAPAREGTKVLSAAGDEIGTICSGGFGPSFGGPVAMAYLKTEFAEEGTDVLLEIRGKQHKAQVAPMPFTPHTYKRASA
ncbi:MAG: glycine cleavage system aminomethyltransferase GcvT [Alphaproteobacteria bacterium]